MFIFKTIHTKSEKSPRNDLMCLHCSRPFSNKNLLRQHINSIHIRERPFSCLECNYTTSVLSSLRLHVRSHTGDKPFKCEECGYKTSDHNTLRKHKMRHTGEKTYACSFCTYKSIQASSYKKHLKTKHPGSVVIMLYCIMYIYNFIHFYRVICEHFLTLFEICVCIWP